MTEVSSTLATDTSSSLTKLEKAIKKAELTEWYNELQSKSAEDIKANMVQHEGRVYEIDRELEENDEINAAKEVLKELTAPYKETKKTEQLKIKALCSILENRGVEIK